jgi:hypothetical protein
VERAYERGIQNVDYASLAFSIEGILLVPAARTSTRRWVIKIEVYPENTDRRPEQVSLSYSALVAAHMGLLVATM